ncbi:unnamed protein product [Effrenium voratum]|nr:unnamed protein product [Effrenium voratum]
MGLRRLRGLRGLWFCLACLALQALCFAQTRHVTRPAREPDKETKLKEEVDREPAGKPGVQEEEAEVSTWTYIFGKPGELRRDLSMVGTSPEKILAAGLLALVIGLGSNLWGQTELLFRLWPGLGEKAREVHLDSLYAVDGLKTYYDEQYQARFPSEWLFDQRVALIKARQSSPDDMLGFSRQKAGSTAQGVVPDAAWGPAGGGDRNLKKRENLSVVKQVLPPKPSGEPQEITEILGDPQASLDRLLRETIAPEGSKKTVEAISAAQVERASHTYYEYQWRSTFPSGVQLRSYSGCSLGPADARGSRSLLTLTLVLPEPEADKTDGVVQLVPQILEGFRVAD